MDFDYSTETITPDNTSVLTIGGTGALELPTGTTLTRPGDAIAGAIRWNTTNTNLEFYNGTTWENVNNTVVLGTTNQITSTLLGATSTLSIPTNFIAPGSITYLTQFGYSSEYISAAGTTQLTATPITKSFTVVNGGSVTNGVRLPTPLFTGETHIVNNASGVEIYIWPQVGGSIDDLTINTNTYCNVGGTIGVIWTGSTWMTTRDNVSSGNSGISIADVAGNISISNSGVLSFSAGTTGLTPLTSATGAVVLGGTLSIGAGGTNATSTTSAFNNLSPLTTAGDTLYFNGTNNVRLPISSNSNILSIVSGEPSWITQASMNVGAATTATTATNIAGGTAGSIPYQTSVGATSFLSVGSTNTVLTVVGGVPTWQTVTTALGYTPVNKAGDTMSGILTLNADPLLPMQAATKQYVDAGSAGLTVQPSVKIAQLTDLTTIGTGVTGPIATVGTYTPGTLYTNGTYTNVPILSNNIGAGAYATVVITTGSVSSFTITTPGNRYAAGDELYIGGIAGTAGAGFVCTVATVSANWGTITYTAGSADANGGTGIGATLTPSANGLFVLDGYIFSINDRVLIKSQTNQIQNGIYTVTALGGPSSAWVLTRATDYDDSVINQVVPGNYIFVTDGKINKNTGWSETAIGTSSVTGTKTGAIKIGTDNIVYAQFSGNTSYTSETGIDIIGTGIYNTGVLSITTSSGLSTNTSAIGNVSITNTGVTSVTAGTGIAVSSSSGAVTISSTTLTSQNVSSNYTVLSTDGSIFANAASGTITISLPATPADGELHNIKKVDQTRIAVIISGNGHNIDNYSTITVNIPYTNMTVQWNASATTWQIL